MSIKMKELPQSERPYEKLELYGERALSNAELLAIIIKTGTKSKTSIELAQNILNLNENCSDELSFLKDISIEEFMQINGIGKVKSIQLKAVCELSNRMMAPSNYKKIIVKTPQDLANLLMPELKNEKQEIVKVIILNVKNQILKILNVAIGDVGHVNVSISNILSEPVKMKAPKIIIAHNHPTGDPKPSNEDIEFTHKLLEASSLLGIEMLDHIVIGDMKYISIFSEIFSK